MGRRFGLTSEYATAREIFDEIGAKVPAFSGLTFRALGDLGAPAPGGATPGPAGAGASGGPGAPRAGA